MGRMLDKTLSRTLWPLPMINVSNNINGINGDPSGNDNGEEVHSFIVPAITTLQEAYVRKVVDTLNDLDNVLYEISGDAPSSSRDWQNSMINYLKCHLTLTWQDNSTNENNFAIERKTGTSGTYAQIAMVAANIVSYVDTRVSRGVTYCYRVDAADSAGSIKLYQ